MKKKKNIGKSNFYLAFIEREKKHEQLDRVKSVPDEMLQDTTILVKHITGYIWHANKSEVGWSTIV